MIQYYMVPFIKKHGIFIICLFIFLLFLARNPFSTRTLIPNFEPYPDALHYVAPARNFALNSQFAIVREDRVILPRVPPLYSVFLIPFYMVNSDPRFFYFANVFLALFSFFLFFLIVKHLVVFLNSQTQTDTKSANRSRNKFGMTENYKSKLTVFQRIVMLNLFQHLILFFPLFLYITNYFNYWYPTLAMSENLTIFLFLLNLYIITKPINKVTAIMGGFLPFAFFITKYAHITLTCVFLLAYSVKVITDIGWKNKKKLGLFFGGSLLITFLLLLYLELLPGISTLFNYLAILLHKGNNGSQITNRGGSWFSLIYVKDYLPQYLRAMIGGYSVRFLWDNTPIVPIYIGTPGVLGLLLGIFNKKTRLLSVTLLSTLLSSVFFMSTFYSLEMRYLYQAIPAILIGFVIFWIQLQFVMLNLFQHLKKTKTTNKTQIKIPKPLQGKQVWYDNQLPLKFIRYSNFALNILLCSIFCFYTATNAIRFKKQIMLNLKYAETPWYYLSVVKLNDYFKSYPKNKPAPVVISSLIPYYVDFYSDGNYSLLPLSLHQEFRDNRKEAWGDFDYTDLIKLYYKVLLSGHELFVHNYGLGNEKVLHDDFEKIQENFNMTKVSEGCYGLCDIWQLRMKWGIEWIYNKNNK